MLSSSSPAIGQAAAAEQHPKAQATYNNAILQLPIGQAASWAAASKGYWPQQQRAAASKAQQQQQRDSPTALNSLRMYIYNPSNLQCSLPHHRLLAKQQRQQHPRRSNNNNAIGQAAAAAAASKAQHQQQRDSPTALNSLRMYIYNPSNLQCSIPHHRLLAKPQRQQHPRRSDKAIGQAAAAAASKAQQQGGAGAPSAASVASGMNAAVLAAAASIPARRRDYHVLLLSSMPLRFNGPMRGRHDSGAARCGGGLMRGRHGVTITSYSSQAAPGTLGADPSVTAMAAAARAAALAAAYATPGAMAPGGTAAVAAAAAAAAKTASQGMHYEAELEINDFPQHARWKLAETTGAAVTTRGLFVPPGKSAPEGERKLYLLIEGPTELTVKRAKQEIKRMIEETTEKVMRRDAPAAGKYSVV
eukprot:gene3696-13764_t